MFHLSRQIDIGDPQILTRTRLVLTSSFLFWQVYREYDSVDVYENSDAYVVGRIADGEYMRYPVDVSKDGTKTHVQTYLCSCCRPRATG